MSGQTEHTPRGVRRGLWVVLAAVVSVALVASGAFAVGRSTGGSSSPSGGAANQNSSSVKTDGYRAVMTWALAHEEDLSWMSGHMDDFAWMRHHNGQWQWIQTHPRRWTWMREHWDDMAPAHKRLQQQWEQRKQSGTTGGGSWGGSNWSDQQQSGNHGSDHHRSGHDRNHS